MDFEAPLFMTDNQRKKFLEGMKKIFGNIITHNVRELDKEMGEIERHPQKWTPEELVYLLSDKSHEEIGRILHRDYFSIKSKRGVWLAPFYTWATKHGYVKEGHIKNKIGAIKEYERSKE